MNKHTSIPFNKSVMLGKELENIRLAIEMGHLSSGGFFSNQTEQFFCTNFGVKKAILTSSCTAALEMVALLLNVQVGDEIIAPSYAFVSTVNPFVMRGAKIIFADSCFDHPNMNVDSIEALITPKTKAVICIHYAGVACNLTLLNEICKRNKIYLIEDAAHAIDAQWNKSEFLGTVGTFGTFSFHETKNISAGEGGMLCINDELFFERATVISDKGTNRSSFLRGETNKYEWVDIGSSFQVSELTAAFLMAQLLKKDKVLHKRVSLWNFYFDNLVELASKGYFSLPKILDKTSNNGHIFYIVLNSKLDRDNLISLLKDNNIQAVFHYQSLHCSPFYKDKHDNRDLPNADRFSNCLLRLPLFYDLEEVGVDRISKAIHNFFNE